MLGAGRGREAHLKLSKPWGSLVIPSPPGDWHFAQGRVMVRDGGGGGTAIASNPEQKTGVSTVVVAPDDRSGFQGLQACPRGSNLWWRVLGAFSPTRLARPVCDWQAALPPGCQALVDPVPWKASPFIVH